MLNDVIIPVSDTASNLGVIMDSKLNLVSHISKVCQICYFYLTWIKKVRHCLTDAAVKLAVQCLVLSRLDYCNGILVGLPTCQLHRLQRVMNCAARVVTGISRDDSISAALKQLKWLPIKERIDYKIALLTYKALRDNSAPIFNITHQTGSCVLGVFLGLIKLILDVYMGAELSVSRLPRFGTLFPILSRNQKVLVFLKKDLKLYF